MFPGFDRGFALCSDLGTLKRISDRWETREIERLHGIEWDRCSSCRMAQGRHLAEWLVNVVVFYSLVDVTYAFSSAL